MKVYTGLCIILNLAGFLAGCSNFTNTGDPDAYFKDQMAAFANPAPIPDDQMPPEYDASLSNYNYGNSNYGYEYQGSASPMYQAAPNSSYGYSQGVSRSNPSSPRRSALTGSGGGAEEVPFTDTRRNKMPVANGAN